MPAKQKIWRLDDDSPVPIVIGIILGLLSGFGLSLLVLCALIYQGAQSPIYHLIGNILAVLLPVGALLTIVLVQMRKRKSPSNLLRGLFAGLIAFVLGPVLLFLYFIVV